MEIDGLSLKSSSILLELSASDDLIGFIAAIEQDGLDIDQPRLWYGRKFGSRKKMGFEERTPLMIASLFGSKSIVNYLIHSEGVDVNRACGSDGVTAFHCAVAGFSPNAPEIVKLLLDVSADADALDANGNKPIELLVSYGNSVCIARKKMLEGLLRSSNDVAQTYGLSGTDGADVKEILSCRGSEKKEYPVDPTLPDIKNGIYGTDEFRMYSFKIKPCSRAYSHDWTECPFVHPGENARRRDPRRYHYSCVPCPEFRKGSCSKGDSCDYAHGIFECWLHPAQYRTRLCKDETKCTRRVCFFAHKQEELRPLYASTGSGIPSPTSTFSSCNSPSYDMGPISPLSFCSQSVMISPSSKRSLPPNGTTSSTIPIGGSIWMNLPNTVPPNLQQPPGSRLKPALNARDRDVDEDISNLPSPSSWANALSTSFSDGEMNPTNLETVYDPPGLSPASLQMRRGISQRLRPIYLDSNARSSSSARPNSPFGIDQPSFLSPSSAAFANQRQSFFEGSGVNRNLLVSSPTGLEGWGSPDGKLDWSIKGDELNKMRESVSFGLRNGSASEPMNGNEPDVSWVGSLVMESSEMITGGSQLLPSWIDLSNLETEQTVS